MVQCQPMTAGLPEAQDASTQRHGGEGRGGRLSVAELASAMWFFVWRLAVFSLIVNYDTGVLLAAIFINLTGSEIAGRLIAVILVLLLGAGCFFLIRRFLRSFSRKQFRTFRVRFIRDDRSVGDHISLTAVGKIWWLLYWRGSLLGIIAGALYGFIHPFQQRPDWLTIFIFWQSIFFGLPWAVSVMLRKEFQGFHFFVEKAEP